MTTIAHESQRRSWYPDLALVLLMVVALLCAIRFNPFIHKNQTALAVAQSFALAIGWPSFVVAAIERFRPSAGPRKSLQAVLVHIQIILLLSTAGMFVGRGLGFLLGGIMKASGIKGGLINLETPLTSTAAIVLGLLGYLFVADLVQYWAHRLEHKSRFLWHNHKIHHMDPVFDALTGPRQNWTVFFVYFVLLQIPGSFLFKFSDFDSDSLGLLNGTIVSLILTYLYITHSSMRIQFGWASVLLVSTQTHRIHHSILPQHRDKNFANWFPIWDILFGTYYHPARDEFPPTGVEAEREFTSLWESQVLTLRDWWNMSRDARPSARP